MRTVTPAQFTRQLRAMPQVIESSTRDGVAKAALEITAAARRNIATATRGTSRLSRVGAKGAKVGARYKLNESRSNPSALVSGEGPLQLIERDTKPHGEVPKGVGRAKGRSRAARYQAKQDLYNALFGSGGFAGTHPLATKYGPRFRVAHPGTKGKHPFQHAVDEVEPKVPRIIQGELHTGLSRVIR